MHNTLNNNSLINYALQEIKKYEHAIILHTGSYRVPGPSHFQALTGWNALDMMDLEMQFSMSQIDEFIEKHRGKWIFSHLSYDLKNNLEKRLKSDHPDPIGFPLMTLFVPEFVGVIKDGKNKLYQQQLTKNTIIEIPIPDLSHQEKSNVKSTTTNLTFQDDFIFQDQYHTALNRIHQHLQQGDIYEINYCLPFQGTGKIADPAEFWWSMQSQNQAPFSTLYRHKNSWLMCCSPERFICKENDKIISQPIKGTSKRDSDTTRDLILKEQLQNNKKEQAENVMIVDLVRNDLGKIAQTGSVQVDELFGAYSLKSVHQLISTVSATLKNNTTFSTILKACFPMGSMTGAPKIRAMEIIEELEFFQRGLYSGSVGYISPEGNFDFNVVIRSILYNSSSEIFLYPAGGAITANSSIEMEFEECLLKAQSMKAALTDI
ncbi:MAG: anthranilate synthase component I family protein [Bacteroidetes bacterium]|nr:anthranilate synthase component I family protein [Bacteroidota bacterium]